MLANHLEKLRYFHAVVEENSILAASKVVGISQPALSKSLKSLEQALGVQLLERHRRGVQLTESGRVLFKFTQKLMSELPDTERRVQIPAGMSGVLNVGSYETLGVNFWPLALKRLKSCAPELQIRIVTSSPEEHWQKLESGALHAIVDAEPRISEQFYSKILYSDSFGLYKAAGAATDTLKGQFSYVRRAFDKNGKSVEDNLRELGIQHELTYDFDSFVSVKEVVKAGLAVGVLPLTLAKEDLGKGLLKEYPSRKSHIKFGVHRICVTSREENRNDIRIKCFIETLKKSLK